MSLMTSRQHVSGFANFIPKLSSPWPHLWVSTPPSSTFSGTMPESRWPSWIIPRSLPITHPRCSRTLHVGGLSRGIEGTNAEEPNTGRAVSDRKPVYGLTITFAAAVGGTISTNSGRPHFWSVSLHQEVDQNPVQSDFSIRLVLPAPPSLRHPEAR